MLTNQWVIVIGIFDGFEKNRLIVVDCKIRV